MISSFLPTVFRLLALNPNRAVDDAVARALPSLDESTQEAACQLLLRRGHQASLLQVLGDFRGYGEHLKKLLAGSAESLRPILAELIQSRRTGHSLAAVELVAASGNVNCVDLLSAGLSVHDRQTRESAARGLRRAVELWLEAASANRANQLALTKGIKGASRTASPDQFLVKALSTAVQRWESHEMMPALEAAMWMYERLQAVFREKLAEPRTSIARAISLRLQKADDARCAGFIVWALSIPTLRVAAAQGIASAEKATMREAILQQAWLLLDPAVMRGARGLRDVKWMTRYLETGDETDDLPANALRWLSACGDTAEQRVDRLRSAVDSTAHQVRRDALWVLAGESDEKSIAVLSAVAERRGDLLARVAARALRRHRRTPSCTPASPMKIQDDSGIPTGRSMCAAYWAQAGQEAEGAGEAALRPPPMGEWLVFLRAKLASGQPNDRARALGLIESAGLLSVFQEQVLRLVHDPDPVVRARAVQLLPLLPTPTAGRVARQAVLDSHPRVEANAVEALDRMEQDDRAAATLPKLESPNNRVRGNAVKSLLRLELTQAAEALLAMLEDQSAAHRLSAVWVIEQLELRSLSERLRELCANDPTLSVRRKCAAVLRGFEGASKPGMRPKSTVRRGGV